MICVVGNNRSADGDWFSGRDPDAFWSKDKLLTFAMKKHNVNVDQKIFKLTTYMYSIIYLKTNA